MNGWKWNNGGEKCERSKRIFKQNSQYENYINLETIKENSAYLQSLSCSDGWTTDNNSFYENQIINNLQPSGFVNSNKREDSSFRMAERDMIATTGMNPFLGTNNYVNDVVAQDRFLKPVSTNNIEK
jgi:hypothetical protein